MSDNEDIAARAYIAGLIDGEGYVGIKRRLRNPANRMVSARYSPCVSIAMTDLAAINFVAKFCDFEHMVKERKRNEWKPIFQLDLERDRAVFLLRQIVQFLITKRRRAEICLRLAKLLKTSGAHRTKVAGVHAFQGGIAKGREYRVFCLSDEFNKACDDLYVAALKDDGAARLGVGDRFARHSRH